MTFAYIAWTQKIRKTFGGWATVVWHPDPAELEAVINAFLDGYMLGRQEWDRGGCLD